jgi:hypothetical protein
MATSISAAVILERIEAVVAEVRLMKAQLRAMRSPVDRCRRVSGNPANAVAIDALLPAIERALGDRLFTVSDMAREAEGDAGLRAALHMHGGDVKKQSNQRFGQLLSLAAHSDTPPFRVNAVGRWRDGVIWKIERMRV